MNTTDLSYIVILLCVAVVAVAALRRVKLPPVLAYLATGVLLGPHGLGWVPDTSETHVLAEFGVVFLLFTLGLEFSLPRLVAMKREVLVLGGSQVATTLISAAVFAWALGVRAPIALVLGGAFAMSSTAIVAKQLAEQTELNLQHGRFAIGVLLFQDLAVIPLLILIPAVANGGQGTEVALAILWAIAKGALALLAVFVIGRGLLRPLFHEIANARSAELFTLAVLLITLAAAWATESLGLSLALGAFLAGMMLGETEFRHQVEGDIRPFRDVLLGLFFITVGMLLNPSILRESWEWVLLAVAGLMGFKIVSIMWLSRIVGTDRQMAMRTGLVLAQGGEFGFALISLGLASGLLRANVAEFALAVIVISMLLSPVLIRYNGRIAAMIYPDSRGTAKDVIEHDIAQHQIQLEGHVIIAGFGRVGQNIARFLEQDNFEYIALDLDPVRVRTAREAGDPVYYGDATQLDILRAAGLERAKALVISYFDVGTSVKILEQVKEVRADLPVLVRTRDDSNLERLQAAGATEVIPETLEASLMLASHLLHLLDMPMVKILRRIQDVRANRYRLLRTVFRGQDALPIDPSHAFREQLYTVTLPKGAFAVERSLGELNLAAAGIAVSALRREGIVGKQPGPDTVLREGDVLVLYGTPEDLEHCEAYLLNG